LGAIFTLIAKSVYVLIFVAFVVVGAATLLLLPVVVGDGETLRMTRLPPWRWLTPPSLGTQIRQVSLKERREDFVLRLGFGEPVGTVKAEVGVLEIGDGCFKFHTLERRVFTGEEMVVELPKGPAVMERDYILCPVVKLSSEGFRDVFITVLGSKYPVRLAGSPKLAGLLIRSAGDEISLRVPARGYDLCDVEMVWEVESPSRSKPFRRRICSLRLDRSRAVRWKLPEGRMVVMFDMGSISRLPKGLFVLPPKGYDLRTGDGTFRMRAGLRLRVVRFGSGTREVLLPLERPPVG